MTGKKIIQYGIVIILLILFSGFLWIEFLKSESRNKGMAIECYGIIKDIKIDSLDHGTPYFLINNEWIYLGAFGHSIAYGDGQVGDSISKINGDVFLRLYRKDLFGNYELIERIEHP